MLRSPIARSICSSPSRTSGAPGRIRPHARTLRALPHSPCAAAQQSASATAAPKASPVAWASRRRAQCELPRVRIERQRLAIGCRAAAACPLRSCSAASPATRALRPACRGDAGRASRRRSRSRSRARGRTACVLRTIARLDGGESGRERGAQRRVDALLHGFRSASASRRLTSATPYSRLPEATSAAARRCLPGKLRAPRIRPHASRDRRGGLRRQAGVRRPAV